MRKLLLGLLAFVLLLAAGLGVTGASLLLNPVTPPTPLRYKVEPGFSLGRVAGDLEQAGVLRSALALKLLARLDDRGGQIRSGSYLFSEPATPRQLLERLVAGDVEKVSLTIPEGFTQAQIIARLAELGFGDRDRLGQLVQDAAFLRSLQIEADSLEGYLFPETYRFEPGISEEALLKMMVSQLRARLTPELLEKAQQHNLPLHQWLTLASIIEKETGKVEEMPLISSVFHNRLRKGIPLQTDPTVIYGIANFDGNLTRKHLQTPGPYNTYLNRGLPPGPIASPGLAALKAAVEPAQTKLLYFVSRGDGSHQFSATLVEHNQAVREYQLKRR